MEAMQPIFPVTALQKRQGEVKAAARDNIVRITENGVGAYVFCSEEVFARAIQEAADEAAYAARVGLVVERGRADAAAGRVFRGMEAFLAEAARRDGDHG